jgi:hypothetical protein
MVYAAGIDFVFIKGGNAQSSGSDLTFQRDMSLPVIGRENKFRKEKVRHYSRGSF